MSEKHSFNLSDQAHEIIEGIKWGDKSEWVSEAILLKRQMFDLEWTPRPPPSFDAYWPEYGPSTYKGKS